MGRRMSDDRTFAIASVSPLDAVPSWLMLIRKIEATIGAFFVFAVGFVLLLFGYVLVQSDNSTAVWIARYAWGVSIVAEGFFI